jgi:hypothetical protein
MPRRRPAPRRWRPELQPIFSQSGATISSTFAMVPLSWPKWLASTIMLTFLGVRPTFPGGFFKILRMQKAG